MAYSFVSNPAQNVSQRIYCDIREGIISLDLKPGEKLSEMRVAAQYECSRIPVREAFRKLCLEGYMDSLPQIGSFVRYIDQEKLEQIRYVRECLETRVMTDGLRSGKYKPLIEMLQDNIDQQNRYYLEKNYARVHALDEDFHMAFYESTDKCFVRDFMGINDPDYERTRRIALVFDEHPEYLIRQHQSILNAVKADDEAMLCRAMKEHLTNIYRVLPACPEEIRKYFRPAIEVDNYWPY
ncbi:MAG: GntR family transcriptional regulator [Candidatus Ventricola sp.]